MARELQQTAPDDRRRRVQRLKKMIIGIVIVGLLIPILCCVYLICRLHAINGTLRDLEQRLEELDAMDASTLREDRYRRFRRMGDCGLDPQNG